MSFSQTPSGQHGDDPHFFLPDTSTLTTLCVVQYLDTVRRTVARVAQYKGRQITDDRTE
jgi:hypothetical protein